jgi:hypothetical protein
MSFEWGQAKAGANLRKHGVDFADATSVLEDPCALTVDDDDEGEERFVTIGMDCLGRILVVAYTWRGERIRIISPRRAVRSERREYEAGS